MKQIRLSKGLYALVDDDDYAYLNQWLWYASHESRGTKWYAIRRENGVKIRMHRVIIERQGIAIPDNRVVDHINHNSLDNRRENLEVITQRENMRRSPGWKQRKEMSEAEKIRDAEERRLQNQEHQTSTAIDQSHQRTYCSYCKCLS